ncbi:MAG: dihydrodipicolinate reductase [Gammaproteobacteria bacterium]
MPQTTYRLEPVPMRTYRVIQWFTGQIACEQVRLMARNPRFEIVGAVCHHADKHGCDLGELAGIGPLGVRATANPGEALALDADIVLYNPIDHEIDPIEAILRSGKNVISIMGPWDISAKAHYRRLDEAARAAGVTFHGAGNMPGMLNDVVPAMLSGWTADVQHVWTRERSYHGTYRSADVLARILGYGKPLSEHGPQSAAGAALIDSYVGSFDQAHRSMAFALGVLVEGARWESRLTGYEVAPAPETFTIDTCGLRIEAGTVAGFRYEITSFLDGAPWAVIEVEHVARLALGPQWRGTLEEPEFAVRIRGRPVLEMTFGTVTRDSDPQATMGLVELNAARMVNLIPAVVEAIPGAKSFIDLPIVTALAGNRPG